jgi:hypothetical protein
MRLALAEGRGAWIITRIELDSGDPFGRDVWRVGWTEPRDEAPELKSAPIEAEGVGS